MNKTPSKLIGLIAGPASFLLILLLFRPEGMPPAANAVLATTVWIGIWWITEVIPIAATALLPIILFPLTEGLTVKATTAAYGHRYIFLYMGGFIIAIAIEKYNLHRRIALSVINAVGSKLSNIILGFMIATAFLSMWISNTATAVMMLPIGMAIISTFKDHKLSTDEEGDRFGKALLLAIAYSASIGGLGTLIGTPPNLVLAGIFTEMYGEEITFLDWLKIGLPVSFTLLTICWLFLTRSAFKITNRSFPGGLTEIKDQLTALGKLGYEEKRILVVFVLTALAWISRSYLITPYLPGVDDTVIALTGAMLLFLIPSSVDRKPLMNWGDTVKLPWGIIILFGGGMAIAQGFQSSGLAEYLGNQLNVIDGFPTLAIIFIIVLSMNFLTEITSNLATTAMILPILAPMASSFGLHPLILMVPATLAASCAFMLPVATPPNAVVFGAGILRIPDMMRAGFWLNILSIILITFVSYYLIEVIWDLS
ncbi:MAG: DASS family sodium-coupled anion symporter [Cyclobacteriaceae bacterium]